MKLDLKKLNVLLSNNTLKTVVSLLLALYAGAAAPALPNVVINFFDSVVGKLVFLFLIAYVASRDIQVAIMIAVAFVVTLTVVNNRKIEGFRNMENFYDNHSDSKVDPNDPNKKPDEMKEKKQDDKSAVQNKPEQKTDSNEQTQVSNNTNQSNSDDAKPKPQPEEEDVEDESPAPGTTVNENFYVDGDEDEDEEDIDNFSDDVSDEEESEDDNENFVDEEHEEFTVNEEENFQSGPVPAYNLNGNSRNLYAPF